MAEAENTPFKQTTTDKIETEVMMKFEFINPPTIGFTMSMDGQRFDLVNVVDHQKRDGTVMQLNVWRSQCPVCKSAFIGKSPRRKFPGTRRCEDHRQPGVRVRRVNRAKGLK